ncbi:MAG: PAC2 family protein [Actinomycetales bacterium]|nr:PAC2 family protein [Actinomycetales bacterium]
MKPQWFKKKFAKQPDDANGLPLIVALDGFLSAGNVGSLVTKVLRQNDHGTVYEFDVDSLIDHRARRPGLKFNNDHYHDYRPHRRAVTQHHDLEGAGYLLLSGPEPDYGWDAFVDEVHDIVDEHDIPLVLSVGGVPMGVPHTRPPLLTSHGTRPELVDRKNLWDAEIQIPASVQSLLELRLGESHHDAAGYVVHVPHYLAQVDYPTAALELIDAVGTRLDRIFNVEQLIIEEDLTNTQIKSQIDEQGGLDVLEGLEQQYDAFHSGGETSLLADSEELPSGEELAHQFEEFLARQTGEDQN